MSKLGTRVVFVEGDNIVVVYVYWSVPSLNIIRVAVAMAKYARNNLGVG